MAHLYPQSVGVDPINRFTLALADAADSMALETPVLTCPGWTMADLVWHLTGVQDFWTYIIATRPGGPDFYEQPTRPSDSRLVANLRNAVAGLTATLKTSPATDAAWSWADEQTVGFTLRRQTHEALTHCADGVLTADQPLPQVAPELAADGVDEFVHVMLPNAPEADSGSITLHSTDTNDQWSIRLGDTDATVAGTALDLNLWLWGRGKTWPLSITGDTNQAAALRSLFTEQTHG